MPGLHTDEKKAASTSPSLPVVILNSRAETVLSIDEQFARGEQLWQARNFGQALTFFEYVAQQAPDTKVALRYCFVRGLLIPWDMA